MKTAQSLILTCTIGFGSSASAWAGPDHASSVTTVSSQEDTNWQELAVKSRYRGESRHSALRVAGAPVILLGRTFGTLIHWPQILSETIMGERAVVNKRGVLGTREIPAEDRYFSNEEGWW
jgi:hypothetical protein